MELYTNSMLKDWKTCRNKYYFKYIKKIVIPQKEEHFELGKKVHALISYYLNGFDMDVLEKAADDEVLLHYNSILKHPLIKKKHFLSEWGFNSRIGNTNDIFSGRIDAVFYDKDTGKYIIADWKTGMKIPENPVLEPQAQIYLYSFYRVQKDLGIKIKCEDLSFSFIQTPTLNESTLDFSNELYEKFESDFLKTIREIRNFNTPLSFEENKNCKFCEYKFICKRRT